MDGKVVIVTGAFGVLGAAVAEAFVAAGASVALVDRVEAPPAPLQATLGGEALFLGDVDLTTPAGAAKAVADTITRFGRLDGLANIAGGFRWEPVESGSADTWNLLYALNVQTTSNMCRAAIPALAASNGAIVNVGAGGAVKAGAGMAPYAASKAGVHRLTEALAEELKGKVRVNAVLPSIIDTPANRADMPDADPTLWVAPADLAEVIVFLASDKARAVTGALVAVNAKV
jgi:NAD(P)-dependent dehydrogenase (short-subunit alcohol dehydrogenase family)